MLWPEEPVISNVRPLVAPEPEVAAISDIPDKLPKPPAHTELPAEQVTGTDNDCNNRFAHMPKVTNVEAKQLVREASTRIRSSVDPELILASAAIDKLSSPEQSIQSIRRIGGEKANSPVAIWTLMGLCEQRPSVECDYDAIERNVRLNHSANGAFWLGMAGSMLTDGRDDAAFDAISQALAAPTYDNYFNDQLLLLERGLAASTNLSFAERVFYSVEFAFAAPPGIVQVMKKCQVALAGRWSEQCDQLADQLINYDHDVFANGLGFELKKGILEARNDTEALAQVERRMRALASIIEDEENIREMANALLNDEILLRRFLENLESAGELAAFEKLTDDIERLKTTDGYERCNFVTNPYMRL